MISQQDRDRIVELSAKYGAKRVLLFGSAVGSLTFRDIDLAVEGVPPARFFRYYADLIGALSKPIDLVDLGRRTKFNDLIASEGVVLYG